MKPNKIKPLNFLMLHAGDDVLSSLLVVAAAMNINRIFFAAVVFQSPR
jgi:hypothetical protein